MAVLEAEPLHLVRNLGRRQGNNSKTRIEEFPNEILAFKGAVRILGIYSTKNDRTLLAGAPFANRMVKRSSVIFPATRDKVPYYKHTLRMLRTMRLKLEDPNGKHTLVLQLIAHWLFFIEKYMADMP